MPFIPKGKNWADVYGSQNAKAPSDPILEETTKVVVAPASTTTPALAPAEKTVKKTKEE